MIASLSAFLASLDPAAEVNRLSEAGMDQLTSYVMEADSTLFAQGKGSVRQRFRLLVSRPDKAQVQVLTGDGSLLREVIITPRREVLADYVVYQTARKPRDAQAGLKDAALLRLPTLDPLVLALIDRGGWAEYFRESFIQAKRWQADLRPEGWRLATSTKSGKVAVTYTLGSLIPRRLEISSGPNRWVWTMRMSPLPSSASFEPQPGNRLVPSLNIPPPPKPMDPKTAAVVERMWRFYDKPRPLAIEVKDMGQDPVLVLTDGIRLRQRAGGVDWSYDGSRMIIRAQGRTYLGKAGRVGVTTAAGDSGLRLDPTFGSMVFGDNPFRRLLSAGAVRHKGTLPTPYGEAALLEVITAQNKMTLGVKESDGRVLSFSSLPTQGDAALSATRTFTYLDPGRASPEALAIRTEKGLPLAQAFKSSPADSERG